MQLKHRVRVSSLQWNILNAIQSAGFPVHPEYDDGLFSIDLAVFLPGRNGDSPIRVRPVSLRRAGCIMLAISLTGK